MTRKFYIRQDSLDVITQEKGLNGSTKLYIIPKYEDAEGLNQSINGHELIEIEIHIVGKGRLK